MSNETASAPAKPPNTTSQEHSSPSVTRPLLLLIVAIVILIGIVLYFVIGHFIDDLLHILTNIFQ